MLAWTGFPIPYLKTHFASDGGAFDDIEPPAFLPRGEVPRWILNALDTVMGDPDTAERITLLRERARDVRPLLARHSDGWNQYVQFFNSFWSPPLEWFVPLTLMPTLWFYVIDERDDARPIEFVPAYLGASSPAVGWERKVQPSFLPYTALGSDGDPVVHAVLTIDLDHASDADVLSALRFARQHKRKPTAGRRPPSRNRIMHTIIGLVRALYEDERPSEIADTLWLQTASAFASWIESGSATDAFVGGVARQFEHRYRELASATTIRREAARLWKHGLPRAMLATDRCRLYGAFARAAME